MSDTENLVLWINERPDLRRLIKEIGRAITYSQYLKICRLHIPEEINYSNINSRELFKLIY